VVYNVGSRAKGHVGKQSQGGKGTSCILSSMVREGLPDEQNFKQNLNEIRGQVMLISGRRVCR
jgi:hypothetical protein